MLSEAPYCFCLFWLLLENRDSSIHCLAPGSSHSSSSNSSGMKKSGFWKSSCAPISLKLPWRFSRAQHSTSDRFKMTCRALHRLVNLKKRKVNLGICDVDSFLGGSGTWNFCYICAYQDIRKPEFFLPELLIKELWIQCPVRQSVIKFKSVEILFWV